MESKLKMMLMTSESIRTRLEGVLAESGLSLAKVAVLHHLEQAARPMSLSGLAQQCSCVKSNITHLVDRLEADRLVRRTPDPTDRRRVLAELTREGRSQSAQAWKALMAEERRILKPMNSNEIDQLLTQFQKLMIAEPHPGL